MLYLSTVAYLSTASERLDKDINYTILVQGRLFLSGVECSRQFLVCTRHSMVRHTFFEHVRL